jgi:fatty-acyl-CoA synthase
VNIASLLADGIARAGGRPALVHGSRVLSYRALGDRVGRLAAGLTGLGLRRGDRIVLLMPNRPELVESLWAAFHGGFVAVPVNWHLHPDEVDYIVRHCRAAAIVVSDETAAATRTLPDAVRVVRVARADGSDTGSDGTGFGNTVLGNTVLDYEDVLAPEPSAAVGTAAEDPAWLFYTSGTTGRPKGATLTHRNLAAMTEAYHRDLDPVADGSSYLHAAPLTHGSGLYLLPSTARGATQVIAPGTSFSAGDFVGLIEGHQVTHAAFLAPTMLRHVVDEARGRTLPSLRSVVVGGAPLYQEDLRAAVGALGPVVVQMYGQGESPMTITVMPAAEALEHPGSCGRAFHGVQIRIADPAGEPVPDGADGEVLVRGDAVMRGYWDNPDASAATLAQGWLHTGDIGHLDAGYLHLTDRAKDVIITGGSNVYPREVEEVLLTHPAVREAAVVGVPDPEWGESVRAFVVAAGDLAPGDPTPGELIQYCRDRLASFKKPREVIFVTELPKNAAGKILKRELRQLPS